MAAKGLESKVQAESDKMKQRLGLIGTFLGPQKLAENATLQTEFTDPIRYIDAVGKYASETRDKYGKRDVDRYFKFDAREYVSDAAAKHEKLTVGQYMDAAKTLGVKTDDFELLKELKDKNVEDYLTDMTIKIKKGKASFKERGLYYLLAALRNEVTDNIEGDLKKYADKMYRKQLSAVSTLRRKAAANDKDSVIALKNLEDAYAKREGVRKLPEQIESAQKAAKIPVYEPADYQLAA